MITSKIVVLDGLSFNIQPLPALTAMRLDKKVLTVVLPAISGFKNLSLDAELDLEALSRGISEALGRLPDSDFETLVIDLLACVIYMPKGETPVELTSIQQINAVFCGQIILIYKLLFEVMRFNKFSPFALLEGGGLSMLKTPGSGNLKTNKNVTGNGSGQSGNLLVP